MQGFSSVGEVIHTRSCVCARWSEAYLEVNCCAHSSSHPKACSQPFLIRKSLRAGANRMSRNEDRARTGRGQGNSQMLVAAETAKILLGSCELQVACGSSSPRRLVPRRNSKEARTANGVAGSKSGVRASPPRRRIGGGGRSSSGDLAGLAASLLFDVISSELGPRRWHHPWVCCFFGALET